MTWLLVGIAAGVVLICLLAWRLMRSKRPRHEREGAEITHIYRWILLHEDREWALSQLEHLAKSGNQQTEVFLGLGILSEQQGMHERAAELFRTVMIREDSDPGQRADAAAGYLEALLASGKTDSAMPEAKVLAREHRHEPVVLRAAFKCFVAAQQWDEAGVLPHRIEKLEERKDPTLAFHYHMNLSAWLAGNGNPKTAAAHFRKAADLMPGDVHPLVELAKIQLAAKSPKKALKHLDEALLAIDPGQQRAVEAVLQQCNTEETALVWEDALRQALPRAGDPAWLKLMLMELLLAKNQPLDAKDMLLQENNVGSLQGKWLATVPEHHKLRLLHIAEQLDATGILWDAWQFR